MVPSAKSLPPLKGKEKLYFERYHITLVRLQLLIYSSSCNSLSGEIPTSDAKPKVYVTGKIFGHTKAAVRAIIEEHGYQWSTTVSKNLTMLITGDKPGPKKLEKAKALEIRVLSWEDFVATLT